METKTQKTKHDQTDFLKSQLEKIVVNVGTGRMSQQSGFESNVLPELKKELALITGQMGQEVKSKRAISGFKLRIGQVIGIKTTLRRQRAIDFLTRLINIVLPRIKDFRGLDHKIIGREGTINIGLSVKDIFPEIVPEESKVDFGLEIVIVFKTRKKEEVMKILEELKFPLKK